MRIMMLFLFLLFGSNLYGKIEITLIKHAYKAECNGLILFTVSGDAGPFDVLLRLDNDPTTINTFQGFKNDLCAGDYILQVRDALGCVKEIKFTIKQLSTPKPRSNDFSESTHTLVQNLIVKANPNPFNSNLKLEINGLQNSASGRVKIYDIIGKLIKEDTLEFSSTRKMTLHFDDIDNAPPGIYYINLTLDDGQSITKKIMKY